MPWTEQDLMSLRAEFLNLAAHPSANLSLLARRFGISRKTAYKWVGRRGEAMTDRSRRPRTSPTRTDPGIECLLLDVRDRFPSWGARKLRRFLIDQGADDLPAASTITAILKRNGRISAEASDAAQHWQRFQHDQPNDLWQIDFKGHFPMQHGRCHPLTVLDDCSRFDIALRAFPGEDRASVQSALIECFRKYGLPSRINADNGPPWAAPLRSDSLTRLGAWLVRLQVKLSHSAPRHPQTNGKIERFHRTLKSELISRRVFKDLRNAQLAFDAYREIYNNLRPHEAIGLDTPIKRYRPSPREFPETLPPIEYATDWIVRKVNLDGMISYKNVDYRVSDALHGEHVGLQPTDADGVFDVYFCHHFIRRIDVRRASLAK